MKKYRTTMRMHLRVLAVGLIAAVALLGLPALSASAADTNLIVNGDIATVSGNTATGWTFDGWGTNTVTHDIVTPGLNGGAHALHAHMSAYTDGNQDWYTDRINVTPGATYTYTEAYKATAAYEVDYTGFTAANVESYGWIADSVVTSGTSTGAINTTFTIPPGVVQIQIYHILNAVGDLTTGAYSLTATTVTPPPPANDPVSTTAGQFTNGNLETINSTTGLPANWGTSLWGTNNGKLTTVSTAHGGTHAVRADITTFTNGAVNLYQRVPVTPGKTYKVSVAVASNVAVQVGAQATDANGNELANTWATIANVAANNAGKTNPSTWTVATGSFTAPANAVQEEIMVPLGVKGWVVTDDYTMSVVTAPASFSRGLVTLSFDDGWASQYANVRPNITGLPSTFYIIGNEIGDAPDYMTATQIKALSTAGNEIGNHTWSHPVGGLAGKTRAAIDTEFTKANTALTNAGVPKPTTCAYPEGTYDNNVLASSAALFKTCRSVDSTESTYGAMSPAMFAADSQLKYRTMTYQVTSATTAAQILALANYAKTNKVWVTIMFHEVVNTAGAARGGDNLYVLTSTFQSMMNNVRTSGVTVLSMAKAYDEVAAQVPAA